LLWSAAASADPLDRWAPEIAEASARFGIPEGWIRRVIHAESRGRTLLGGRTIVSRAGAMGLMQLMPGTWRDMRLALGLGSDPHDPHDNIIAGTYYLRLMHEWFGYPGLFAAYNAGPARYAAYLSGRRGLPAETRLYVAAAAIPGRRSVDVAARRPGPMFAVLNAPPARLADAAEGARAAAGAPPLKPTSGVLFARLGGTMRD
jgi:soluble lytic murein transglycosylase-like protein